MLLKSNIDDLKRFLEKGNVLYKEEERYCYAQDSANIFDNKVIPDVVIFVKTSEEVQNVLRYANMHEIPVIARGAGTNTVGACQCPRGGIVLNFSQMNKILESGKVFKLADLLSYAETASKDEESFALVQELIFKFISENIANSIRAEELADIWENAVKMFNDALRLNLDKKQILINIIYELVKAI